jgi:hypothetical protein
MRRLIIIVVVMAAVEVAWALYCAVTGANLFLFYAVLVVASVVFWVPGVAEKRGPRR